jgi:hypothetical protein
MTLAVQKIKTELPIMLVMNGERTYQLLSNYNRNDAIGEQLFWITVQNAFISGKTCGIAEARKLVNKAVGR